MSRMIAAEAHRRLVSDCNGCSERRVLAGDRYWQVAGIGEALGGVGTPPWARAKPLKDDPVMRLLGQASLRKGQVHQRVARFAHRA